MSISFMLYYLSPAGHAVSCELRADGSLSDEIAYTAAQTQGSVTLDELDPYRLTTGKIQTVAGLDILVDKRTGRICDPGEESQNNETTAEFIDLVRGDSAMGRRFHEMLVSRNYDK
jgi:hypothetical protein